MATCLLRKNVRPLMAAGPSLLSSLRLSLLRSTTHSPIRFFSPLCESVSEAASVVESNSSPPPGVKILDSYKEEFEIASRSFSFETGKIARFANGAVVISMDDTHVLTTIACAKSGEGARDFLPLTVSALVITFCFFVVRFAVSFW